MYAVDNGIRVGGNYALEGLILMGVLKFDGSTGQNCVLGGHNLYVLRNNV